MIVHIIPVWSSAAEEDRGVKREAGGGRRAVFYRHKEGLIKNELHIYFLFPHLNYLCNLL